MRDLFTAASADALKLLAQCLTYEPRRRISAKDALSHPYFFALPYPTHPSKLPKTSAQLAAAQRALDEADGGNVEPDGKGPGVKARPPKRKLSEANELAASRNIARKLDFGASAIGTPA